MPTTNEDAPLSPEDRARIREGIAAAVLGGTQGLAESLEHDPAGYLRLVDASSVAAEEAGRLLREAVQGARAAGHSWETVGEVLGVSRQAAQQRFAAKAPITEAGGPERRILTPLTAFNEMAALAEAGRDGWHLVGYGALYHEVEASDRPWEHTRRPLAGGGRQRRLEAEGWIPVGEGWFPWRYFKRPLHRDDSGRSDG
ncbi:hypothetical protein [Kitasatospora sp. NPDC057015]|uniref:hypothetical protein n=1 Tax=Kitasatospora sp. NPDC057015 TaxID=3346001 RepID=UPI0036317443